MKTKILCLFFAFTFLFIITGTLFASAQLPDNYVVATDNKELNLYVDGVVFANPLRTYYNNTNYPEYGQIAVLMTGTNDGELYSLRLEKSVSYTVPAGTKLCMEFIVFAPTYFWGGSSTCQAILHNKSNGSDYTVNSTIAYNDGYSGISNLMPYTGGMSGYMIRRVVVLIDNSSNVQSLEFDRITFDIFFSSSFVAAPSIGMSGVYFRYLEQSIMGEKFPSVDTSEADKLEEDERELLAGISDGRDIGNNILSGMSGNVMLYSGTLAAISAFMADIVGVHGSVSMLVQMSAAIGIACVIIGAGFFAVNRVANKHDASVRANRKRGKNA